MRDRVAIIISAALLFTALAVPSALATEASLPVALAPGEQVLSHSSTTSGNSQYALELLNAIQGVRIGADKTTVLVADGEATHPIEIEYGQALSTGGTGQSGAVGGAAGTGSGTGSTSGGTGGVSLGQVAGLLLGLTVLSRLIGIFRQLAGARR